MECPACGRVFEGAAVYCPGCGRPLSGIIKEQVHHEIKPSLKELDGSNLSKIQSSSSKNLNSKTNRETSTSGNLSYDTDDIRKIEYKKALANVFAAGRINAEKVIFLADKIKELGLDKNEARNIQLDVAKEFRYSLDEEGDLSGGIVLEIDTNKGYVVNEMGNFEVRITNISDENIEKGSISSYSLNLKTKEDRPIGQISANQKKRTFLPFSPTRTGEEIIEICFEYYDMEGNPAIHKSEFQVRVLSKEEESKGEKSITISFNAEKIMANDFSKIAGIIEKEKKPAPDKLSSYEESEKRWRRLPIFRDEEVITQKRKQGQVEKKFKEGEKYFSQGIQLKNEADRMDKISAIDIFRKSHDCFREAIECFIKIRELDPVHETSLAKIIEIRQIISDLDKKMGKLEELPVPSAVKMFSGCVSLPDTNKRVYLYSKDRIALGRDSNSDLVLRINPYQPKEKYPENWQKTSLISGKHAEIITKGEQFYIRDTGSVGSGSTNGTFLDGKRLQPSEEYLLKDKVRINVAKVLDLECNFLGNFPKREQPTPNSTFCYTVLGDVAESCFGVDKRGNLNAVKLRRRNNFTEEEEYIILIREITIGRSRASAISIDNPTVSDIHARIFYKNYCYWIEDLNSRHGTWVKGERLNPYSEVSMGTQTEIVIGNTFLKFQGYSY